MRRTILMIALAAAAAGVLQAGDTTAPPTSASKPEGSTQVGGSPSPRLSGDKSGVSEYQPTRGGLVLDGDIFIPGKSGALNLKLEQEGFDKQNHFFGFDINRVVRSVTAYQRLPHNLGHDPMLNLEAVTAAGRELWHTDASPGAEYGFKYGNLDHRTEVQLGQHFILAGTYRDQHRSGHVQSYQISHCEGCHVQSQSRRTDERTRDAGVEASFAWVSGLLKGSYAKRTLREDVPWVLNQYDRAVHPEQRKPLFDNRISYGLGEGPLPADLRPDADKSTTRLDLVLPDVAGFAVTGGGTWTTTEDLYTGLQSDYKGYIVTAARLLPSGFRFSWRGRAYTLDNDDVFINIAEPVGSAGPQAGKTYREVYGFNPDWTRHSVLNRDVAESRLDVTKRLGKKAGNVRFTWDYQTADRKYYEVAPGKTTTTKNVLTAAWNTRVARRLRLDARYSHGEAEHPFMYLDGSCSTLKSNTVTSPFDPLASQYFQHHASRVADTTASPRRWDEVRLLATYAFGRSSLSANGRYWSGQNTAGDLTDWSRDHQAATLTYSFAPAEQWSLYANYSHLRSSTSSPFCIPLFDG